MKKSKIALAAFVATALGVSALGLAACDDDEKPKDKGVYTITFDANGGAYSAGTQTPVTRKTLGGKLTAFPNAPSVAPSAHPDYTFKGWAYSKTATADNALKLPVTFTGDKTLYAIWGGEVASDGAYLITFDPNGGTIAGESTMTTVDGKLTSTLPEAQNGDREFLGWYTVKDSTDDKDKVVVNVTAFTAPSTVYATWGEEAVQEQYVTFNANGGKFDDGGSFTETTTVKTSGGVIANLPAPVRDGYVFAGFYKDADSDARPFTATTVVTERNLVVYAHWNVAPTDNYITVGDKKYNLTDRSAWLPDQPDDRDKMYSIGSMIEPGVNLAVGDKITISVDGEPISFFLVPSSTGVDLSVTDSEISEITVEQANEFEIYVVHYPQTASRPNACWSVEVKGKTIETPDPDHTGAITVGGKDYSLTYRSEWLPNPDDDRDIMFSIGSDIEKGVDLTSGDKFTISIDGEPISFYLRSSSTGVDVSVTDREINEITVTKTANFVLYVVHYPQTASRPAACWSVEVKSSGGETPDPEYGVDGAYVDKALIKAFVKSNENEVKLEHVKFEKNSTIEFVYDGKVVTPKIKLSGGKPCTAKIVLQDGVYTCADGGTFTIYYTHTGMDIGLWIVDEPDSVESELQEGDGLIEAGEVKAEFVLNEDGLNEVKADGVVLNARTELTLKYAGKTVTDFTLKSDSQVTSSVLSGGTLTLEAGKYDFYYDYAAKQLYIGVVGAEIKAETPYLIGKMTEWSLNPAYEMKKGADGKYTITVQIANGVEFKVVFTDADSEIVWDNNYTLSSKVAETVLPDRNIKITGGTANYIITLNGSIVEVRKEGEAPDPEYGTDGVYVGGELVKAFAAHTDKEVKLEHVTFAPDSTLVFVYNGEEIAPVIKKDGDGNPCTAKIVKSGNTYTCESGGTFTIYYQHTGDMGLWIVDEPDRVESELQAGDGLIVDETTYEFVLNEDGVNEVMAVGAGGTSITFAAETSLTLKYAGVAVTDFTLKKGSLGVVADGTLTVPAGAYKFYYDYAAKTIYVDGKVDVGEVPADMVETVKGNQDATHPNVYLVGKYGGLKELTKDYGKLVEYSVEENGYVQYAITVTLEVGDEVAIWIPDWSFLCSTVETGCNVTGKLTTATHGSETYLKVEKAGEYTFYFKNQHNSDRIWIATPA